jgi:hypothetical protein
MSSVLPPASPAGGRPLAADLVSEQAAIVTRQSERHPDRGHPRAHPHAVAACRLLNQARVPPPSAVCPETAGGPLHPVADALVAQALELFYNRTALFDIRNPVKLYDDRGDDGNGRSAHTETYRCGGRHRQLAERRRHHESSSVPDARTAGCGCLSTSPSRRGLPSDGRPRSPRDVGMHRSITYRMLRTLEDHGLHRARRPRPLPGRSRFGGHSPGGSPRRLRAVAGRHLLQASPSPPTRRPSWSSATATRQ